MLALAAAGTKGKRHGPSQLKQDVERITGIIPALASSVKHSAGDALSWEADALPTELLPRGL